MTASERLRDALLLAVPGDTRWNQEGPTTRAFPANHHPVSFVAVEAGIAPACFIGFVWDPARPRCAAAGPDPEAVVRATIADAAPRGALLRGPGSRQ